MNKTTLKINDRLIRVTCDREGKTRVNLYDLCEILKRSDLTRNGEAIKMCPSSLKIAFRKNGKESWSIKPDDVYKLLNIARKENTLPPSLIREIEAWANRIIENERPQVCKKPETVILYYQEDFPVTFQIFSNRIMVNATQITMPFQKLPSEWLRTYSADNMRRNMEKTGIAGPYESQIFTTRGRGKGATWIEAPLAVALARWITPQTDLAEWCRLQIETLQRKGNPLSLAKRPVAKQKLNRHPLLDIPLPDDLKTACKMIEELRKKIEEDTPKIEFYNEFVENRESFKSVRIADELEISAPQLHQFLFEEGICKYENRKWVVFNNYKSWQCDIPYVWTDGNGKTYTFGSTKRWTHVGRENIIDLWNKKHPESQI